MTASYQLGEKIKATAIRKGVSDSDLAKTLNCSEEFINKLLKGRAYLSWNNLEKLAEKLDVSTGFLIKEEPVSDGKRFIIDIINHYIDICDAINSD